MNPVVVICTHDREDITSLNINTLLNQSVVPKIVLVVSHRNEIINYKVKFPQINIIFHPNTPLGDKWCAGIQLANKLNCDPLIITGSDDILGGHYIKNACELIERGFHFIGLKKYWVHHRKNAFLIDYLASQPLGGGRVYSRKMLEVINFKVFDSLANRKLDDQGFSLVKSSGLQFVIIDSVDKFTIHSVKGNWIMMNLFNVDHHNLRVCKKDKTINVFPCVEFLV